MNPFRAEPALIYGFVGSAIALVIAFGLDLSSEQTGAIMASASAVLAFFTRQSVYAPDTVVELTGGTAGHNPPDA